MSDLETDKDGRSNITSRPGYKGEISVKSPPQGAVQNVPEEEFLIVRFDVSPHSPGSDLWAHKAHYEHIDRKERNPQEVEVFRKTLEQVSGRSVSIVNQAEVRALNTRMYDVQNGYLFKLSPMTGLRKVAQVFGLSPPENKPLAEILGNSDLYDRYVNNLLQRIYDETLKNDYYERGNRRTSKLGEAPAIIDRMRLRHNDIDYGPAWISNKYNPGKQIAVGSGDVRVPGESIHLEDADITRPRIVANADINVLKTDARNFSITPDPDKHTLTIDSPMKLLPDIAPNDLPLPPVLAGQSQDALRIPVPSERHNGARSYLTTFNALAESPAPHAVGQVNDMVTFSKSLGLPPDAKKEEFWIKDTGTGFYIPPQYEQFEETARKMIERYYALHGDDGPVAMAVHQAVIQPNSDDPRPYINAHKDISLSRIKNEGKAPDVYSLIVSDDLMTGFSDYPLSESDIQKITDSDDPDRAIGEILNNAQVDYKSSAQPGTIMAFPATSDHAVANPAEPKRRTVMIMAFFPEGEKPTPGLINNPWLDAAMAERDKRTAGASPSSSVSAGLKSRAPAL